MSPTDPSPFEEVEHTADLGLRVTGQDLKRLFIHAAHGMMHLMAFSARSPAPQFSTYRISLDSHDLETLLVDWLGELLYLSERDRVCFLEFVIDVLEGTHLQASVIGQTGHIPSRAIKAVTFHDLVLRREQKGYETTITFDA